MIYNQKDGRKQRIIKVVTLKRRLNLLMWGHSTTTDYLCAFKYNIEAINAAGCSPGTNLAAAKVVVVIKDYCTIAHQQTREQRYSGNLRIDSSPPPLILS